MSEAVQGLRAKSLGLKRILLAFFFWTVIFSFTANAGEYSNGLDTAVRSDQEITRQSRNIHVAVTIDRNSLGQFLLAMHSAVKAAQNPSKVVIHVVACGVDQADAKDIAAKAEAALQNCLARNRRYVVPWVLPIDSGFRQQMSGANSRFKSRTHHWTSPTGADMARFFLPSLFPDVPRLLYIDNDVIISCCLDEIFDTSLNSGNSKNNNAIVGLALDDLKWATATQFQRHYNSTHPLVIKNMRRRGYSASFASEAQVLSEKDTAAKIRTALLSMPSTENSAATDSTPSSSVSGTGTGGYSRKHVRKNARHGHGSGNGAMDSSGNAGATTGGGGGGGGGRFHPKILTDAPIGGLGAPGEDPTPTGPRGLLQDSAIGSNAGVTTGIPRAQKYLETRAMQMARAGSAVQASTSGDHPASSSLKSKRGPGGRAAESARRNLAASPNTAATSPIDPAELSVNEFVTALPRYPNDGVMLFDVPKYNIANILHIVDEIAKANAKDGDYVVNLGTQQFTVLALWDRWAELSPRANLRHFPDMARGYLMWFLYNGIIHYAGAAKPASLCAAGGGMELRRMSYTPWATTLRQLTGLRTPSQGHPPSSPSASSSSSSSISAGDTTYADTCQAPEPLIANITQCAQHIPIAPTIDKFFALLAKVSQSVTYADDGLLHVRIGALSASAANSGDIALMPAAEAGDWFSSESDSFPINDANKAAKATETTSAAGVDGIAYLDAMMLRQVSWSWYVFDNNGPQSRKDTAISAFESGQKQLKAYNEDATAVARRAKLREEQVKRHAEDNAGNKKAPKIPDLPSVYAKRAMQYITTANVCDGRVSHNALVNKHKIASSSSSPQSMFPIIDYGGNIDPASPLLSPCQGVLTFLKQMKPRGKSHWDVVSIVIDIQDTGAGAGAADGSHASTSLQALLALNLDFMRPKFIAVRVPIDEDMGWEISHPLPGAAKAATATATATAAGAAFKGTGRSVTEDRYDISRQKLRNYNTGKTYGYVDEHAGSQSAAAMPGVHTGASDVNDEGVGNSVHRALRFLTRHGYIAYSDTTGRCDKPPRKDSKAQAKPGADAGAGSGKYTCVWGTLLNTLEFEWHA